MSFLYSGSFWSSLYCGISSLWAGLYRWLVKVSWLGKLVSVFWWVELYFFSLECNEVSSNESMVLGWLWAACILELRAVFLCCWRICLVCLALELIGPCVVLGFSVGMEAFDELLSIRSMEQNRKPRDKSMHIWTPYLWQRRQKYTMD